MFYYFLNILSFYCGYNMSDMSIKCLGSAIDGQMLLGLFFDG